MWQDFSLQDLYKPNGDWNTTVDDNDLMSKAPRH